MCCCRAPVPHAGTQSPSSFQAGNCQRGPVPEEDGAGDQAAAAEGNVVNHCAAVKLRVLPWVRCLWGWPWGAVGAGEPRVPSAAAARPTASLVDAAGAGCPAVCGGDVSSTSLSALRHRSGCSTSCHATTTGPWLPIASLGPTCLQLWGCKASL